MNKKYTVTLTADEREHLEMFVHRGKANARTLTRARILLRADDGWSDTQISTALDVGTGTIQRVRQTCCKQGIEPVLHDKIQQHRRHALSGHQEAQVIAIACSAAPDGHDHWTVRLLADKVVALGFVSGISPNTIHQVLKKMN